MEQLGLYLKDDTDGTHDTLMMRMEMMKMEMTDISEDDDDGDF